MKQHHPADKARIRQLERELRAALLEERIQRLVDQAPPLSPEQKDRLVTLLRGAA